MRRRHACLWLAALAACSDEGGPAEPIHLGVVSPLTGDLSAAGRTQQDGLLLAVAEINAKGGVLGRPLALDPQDDGTTAEGSTLAYSTLLNKRTPIIIGPAWSGGVRAIAKQIREGKTLTISEAATAPDLGALDDDGYFFRTVAPDSAQASALVPRIVSSGCKHLCVVWRDDDYGNGLSDAIRARLPASVKVTSSKYDPRGASLAQVMTACDPIVEQPDAGVLFITFQGDGALILPDAARRGWKTSKQRVFLVDGNARQELWENLDDTTPFENAIGTASSGPDPRSDAGARRQGFRDRFQARYEYQAATYAENHYDTAYLAAMALQIAGTTEDREAIRDALMLTSTGADIDAGDWAGILTTLNTYGQADYGGASGEVDLDPSSGELLPPYYVRLWTLRQGRIVDTEIVTVSTVIAPRVQRLTD